MQPEQMLGQPTHRLVANFFVHQVGRVCHSSLLQSRVYSSHVGLCAEVLEPSFVMMHAPLEFFEPAWARGIPAQQRAMPRLRCCKSELEKLRAEVHQEAATKGES